MSFSRNDTISSPMTEVMLPAADRNLLSIAPNSTE